MNMKIHLQLYIIMYFQGGVWYTSHLILIECFNYQLGFNAWVAGPRSGAEAGVGQLHSRYSYMSHMITVTCGGHLSLSYLGLPICLIFSKTSDLSIQVSIELSLVTKILGKSIKIVLLGWWA